MNRKIKKIAVLGSGVMGAGIACHFANIGCEVELLDIPPRELTEKEQKKGLTLESPQVRNRIADDNLKFALKSKPSPIYKKEFAERIRTGNFDDHLSRIKDCDWVIEVVIENLAIKKSLFERVEQFRTPGTIISSNTSGIPIQSMLEERSDDFQAHFVGTHFFNPPRYLQLLEIIPTEKTNPELLDFLMSYGEKFLGKTTVHAKDTPAFIANRIGVFSIMAIFKLKEELSLSIEEIDAITGPLTGRPKSATFRTCDLVGIDTLVKVANNTKNDCPEDESRDIFDIPAYVSTMVENGWLGQKVKKGFYQRIKDDSGKKVTYALNTKTMEYAPKDKVRFASIGAVKPIDSLKKRLQAFVQQKDKAADFYKKLSAYIFTYSSHRIPEISEELYKIDDALRAGFGWELGPFENWDILGVEKTLEYMKSEGFEVASWIEEMLANGNTSFYKIENGEKKFYDISSKTYKAIPGASEFIILDNLRSQKPVWQNQGATLHDIGDGVLCLEFHTKMNAIGSEIIQGINIAIDKAEKEYRGLVIGNDAPNFSAGANLAMMLMLAIEQEWDELNFAISAFQKTMMKVRYSGVPVVVAPHGLTLGGGCEMSMHADKVVASSETYIGLVEVGAGLIPAGGGTKEMVMRAAARTIDGDVEMNELQRRFLGIAQAKVATSAYEAFDLGIFRDGTDEVIVSPRRVISEAKKTVIALDERGYTQAIQNTKIKVQGRSALGAMLSGIYAFQLGNYITDHDAKIAKKLAYVMTGGDLSAPSYVSEQYLLDLEREAFLSLLGEKKTLERMQSLLKTGKPLRN